MCARHCFRGFICCIPASLQHCGVLKFHFSTGRMEALRGHETWHNHTGTEGGGIWTHILWLQNLWPPQKSWSQGQTIHCPTVSLIFAFPCILPGVACPVLSPILVSLESQQSLRGTSWLRFELEESSETPHLLLWAKEAQAQKGYYVCRLERRLPIRKPIWLRICGQTSKAVWEKLFFLSQKPVSAGSQSGVINTSNRGGRRQ